MTKLQRLKRITRDLKEIAQDCTSVGHMIAPFIVMTAALAFHALHNPLPLLMFLAMVACAYGAKMFRDFLKSRTVTGTMAMTDSVSKAETSITNKIIHVFERNVEDGMQATNE